MTKPTLPPYPVGPGHSAALQLQTHALSYTGAATTLREELRRVEAALADGLEARERRDATLSRVEKLAHDERRSARRESGQAAMNR